MIWDNLDIFLVVSILKSALEDKDTTSWVMTREFFKDEICNLKDEECQNYLTKKCSRVNERLKVMAGEGIIKIEKNGRTNKFVLVNERVFLEKHMFHKKRKDALLFLTKEKKWCAYEI